jgi:hypothetical protein
MKRCAIYTRKSSDEGLEQHFNSLDAQRESCEAYILSQAGEGWTALPGRYDDGGFSGGSMERPGLQRLLIAALINKRPVSLLRGGEGGIRTHGTVARTPHFECGAFDHSATSPHGSRNCRADAGSGRTRRSSSAGSQCLDSGA